MLVGVPAALPLASASRKAEPGGANPGLGIKLVGYERLPNKERLASAGDVVNAQD